MVSRCNMYVFMMLFDDHCVYNVSLAVNTDQYLKFKSISIFYINISINNIKRTKNC